MNDPNGKIADIYARAKALHAQVKPGLGTADLGYEVLYGPPLPDAPILFVGFQPGGDKWQPLPVTWPTAMEYGNTHDPYPLASRLQLAFKPAFLNQCNAVNAIFLRAPSEERYRTIDAAIRSDFEKLSLQAVQDLIGCLRPRLVVTLGFNTMKLFTTDEVDPLESGGRWLLYRASIAGTPAVAIRHPTGARPPASNDEMKEIGDAVRQRLAETD